MRRSASCISASWASPFLAAPLRRLRVLGASRGCTHGPPRQEVLHREVLDARGGVRQRQQVVHHLGEGQGGGATLCSQCHCTVLYCAVRHWPVQMRTGVGSRRQGRNLFAYQRDGFPPHSALPVDATLQAQDRTEEDSTRHYKTGDHRRTPRHQDASSQDTSGPSKPTAEGTACTHKSVQYYKVKEGNQ